MEFKYCIYSNLTCSYKRLFTLEENGEIKDYFSNENFNEKYWETFDNEIHLYSRKREKIIALNFIGNDDFYLYYRGLDKNKNSFTLKITDSKKNLNENRTKITNNEDVKNGILSVGEYTYGHLNIIDKKFGGKVIIGDYCSIAHGVNLILGNHRIDSASTYPFNELAFVFMDRPINSTDHFNKGDIVIGNDVWIGCNSHIMAGVNIGDGAIIASNSVVTKSVDNYSIVAGNPAIHKKYKIPDEDLRKKMQFISWWKWDEKKIIENIYFITELKIDDFVNKFYKN